MDDLISRQAVLKIIDGWYEQNRDTDNIEDLIVLITYMDSVNPQKPICPSMGIDCENCPAYEPKTGHWIRVGGHYICSCCKCDPLDFLEPEGLDGGSYMDTPMKYCPTCGMKMSEGSGEE